MDRIRLLARADDAGLNETANRAIRATARRGIVRNIGLMAPAPAIEDAAEVLSDLADKVDFGLHVTLNAEWADLRWGPILPLEAVSTLTRKDGTFHYTVEELAASAPEPEQLVAEVSAQLDGLTALGFPVSYIDEHMKVGSVGQLAGALRELAQRKGLVYHRDLIEGGGLSELPGWPGPREHPGTELADFLSGLAGGTYYLVGHPVYKSEEMQELHFPNQQRGHQMTPRNRQRRMFADIEIVDYCRNRGIELIRYRSV